MAVYLLHSDTPLGDGTPSGSARHYCGYAPDGDLLSARLGHHLRGTNHKNAPKIVDAFHRIGAELVVARVWPGADHAFERAMKRRSHFAWYCPACATAPVPSGVLGMPKAQVLEWRHEHGYDR